MNDDEVYLVLCWISYYAKVFSKQTLSELSKLSILLAEFGQSPLQRLIINVSPKWFTLISIDAALVCRKVGAQYLNL